MNHKKGKPISARNRCQCKWWKFAGNTYNAKHISVQRSIEKLQSYQEGRNA